MNNLLMRAFFEFPAMPEPAADEFIIKCRLIPLGQTIALIALIVLIGIVPSLVFGPSELLKSNEALMCLVTVGRWLSFLVAIPVIVAASITMSLKLTPQGISMKSGISKETLFHRDTRSWADLHTVRLRKAASSGTLIERLRFAKDSRLSGASCLTRFLLFLGKGWLKQGFLFLDFTSGGMAAFPLAGFSMEGLEDLFLALSRWADPMNLNPEVIALQRDVLTGQELPLTPTYTKMWEESLRHRFELTNFVPLLSGQYLADGRLKILMLLACGGMSSVYLACDSSGKRVVVKEMVVGLDDNDVALAKIHEMFSREADILGRLNHPQIVRVLDHFVEKGRDYLVLEFVPGLTLRQHVQMHGPFQESEVREIASQLGDLCGYLHNFEPPIVHRDLTPDNLIVSEPDKKITLIDFGAANEVIGKVTGTLIGKQCYIPPEQFQGKAVPQSDIYAAGATLSFLLTGEDPEPIAVSHPRIHNQNISEEMDAFTARATALEADSRFPSMTEWTESLENFLPERYRKLAINE